MTEQTVPVVRVDGLPLGPLEDILGIIHQYTERVDAPIEVPVDRLAPYHTLYLEDDGWTMAHPLWCQLDTCIYHEEMLVRGKPPYETGAYAWDGIDDELIPVPA